MENITMIFGKNGFVGKNLDINAICPTVNECDLLDYFSVYSYLFDFRGKKIKIINLAAKVAGALYNKNHNVEMLYDNTLMVLNLIKAIKELKLDVYYLYVSSVCSYENNSDMDEINFFNGLPADTNFGYGIAKKNGVFCLKSLKNDLANFKYGVLIPTNMYGDYDNISPEFSHVIPSLFRKTLKNTASIEILGNANNTRNFLHVSDLCATIKVFVENEIEDIFNVSSDEDISIYNLAYFIKEMAEYKGEFIFNYNDNLECRRINNSKIKEIFNKLGIDFRFKCLKDGLNLSKGYYLKKLSN